MKAITLATLENNFQVEDLQGALSHEGIESFTRDDVFSMFSNMPGSQIEVLVYAKDYHDAFDIFRQGFPDLVEDSEYDVH